MSDNKLEKDVLLKTRVMGFDKKGVMDFIENLQKENEDLKRKLNLANAEIEKLKSDLELYASEPEEDQDRFIDVDISSTYIEEMSDDDEDVDDDEVPEDQAFTFEVLTVNPFDFESSGVSDASDSSEKSVTQNELKFHEESAVQEEIELEEPEVQEESAVEELEFAAVFEIEKGLEFVEEPEIAEESEVTEEPKLAEESELVEESELTEEPELAEESKLVEEPEPRNTNSFPQVHSEENVKRTVKVAKVSPKVKIRKRH